MSEKIEASAERNVRQAPTLDWRAVPSHVAEGPPEVRHVDGWLVCETCADSYAQLMAASPKLLLALTALVSGNCVYDGDEIRIKCASHGDAMQRMREGRDAVVAAGGVL